MTGNSLKSILYPIQNAASRIAADQEFTIRVVRLLSVAARKSLVAVSYYQNIVCRGEASLSTDLHVLRRRQLATMHAPSEQITFEE